eukprot:TRINITY_DN7944_c0_g1_i1.p1 TRINITY_DN7944_c0_g1~~TRINITY_DN7944_c0_g1_i1.p1  ORF type:complete len:399 (+),score=77.80 TRINITY_DN7944_c0_g1_i1:137-1333(+)
MASEVRREFADLERRFHAVMATLKCVGETEQQTSSDLHRATATKKAHYQLVLPSSLADQTIAPSSHDASPSPNASAEIDRSKDLCIPSPPPAPSSVAVHSSPCRPWSKADFLHRLETFRVLTFFAQSTQLSPLQFSRYGWANTAVDTVECTFCKKQLSVKDAGSNPSFYTKLNDAHAMWCLWRNNPCPIAFMTISFHSQAKAIQEFESIFKSFDTFPTVPSIQYERDIDCNLFGECLRILTSSHIITDSARDKNVSALVFMGWQCSNQPTNSPNLSPYVQCTYCQRRLVLDSTPISRKPKRVAHDAATDSSTNSFSAKNQHRWYCPWISSDAKPLNVLMSPRAKEQQSSIPGCTRFLQAVATPSEAATIPIAEQIMALQKIVFGVPLVSKRLKRKIVS